MKQRRELVIGGHDVQKGRYPYFVSIDKNNGVVLNGALIAPDIVLSAGHIALNNMDNLTIAVSAWSVLDQKKEVIPVQEWVLHPEWNQFLPGFFSNDFLIIQLAGRSTQKPVQINRNPDIPAAGQDVIITGLGWTNATSLSPATIVQETTLLTVSNEKCGLAYDPSRNLTYAGKIMPTMLCTTSPPNKTRDGCAWDSGAPVIVPGESADTDLLVALGSTGLGCADILFPGIQARVSADLDWIDSLVCALSVDPPSDFNCASQQAMPTALLAATAVTPDLFEEGSPVWLSGLMFAGFFVLFGAIAIQRVGRRSTYTTI